MTEESLNSHTLDELLDLMGKRTAELLQAKKKDIDYKLITTKRQQVSILQKIILSKQAAGQPIINNI